MGKGVRRTKLKARRRLMNALSRAEREATLHPLVNLREEYALNPQFMKAHDRAQLDVHLGACKRCRREHASLVANRGLYMRQSLLNEY